MSKIAVIGLGHGGIVAAIKLAQNGHSVEIFEKMPKGEVSYDWYDDIRFDIFDIVDIDAPNSGIYFQKSDWRFISPDTKNYLDVPPAKPMEEISVSRRGLIAHLTDLAEKAGCVINYGVAVNKLLIEETRICGITTANGDKRFDLVIDASGLKSPFRAEIPKIYGIQSMPEPNGVMRGYRAFFQRVENSKTPSPASSLYVKHQNDVGISWCNLNQLNEVDVLIGRIGKLSESEKTAALADLSRNNDIFDNRLPKSELWVDIGVRCPIAMFVADGYALIGDSAFMSMPLMGSGIESSMKAGKWFADVIEENGITDFTAANMWKYELKFFEELGRDYVFIDVIKRWALNLPPEELNWLFGCGVVTNDDMALVSTDSDIKVRISVKEILHKVGILFTHFGLICQAIRWLVRAAKAKSIAKRIPKKFSIKKIRRWQTKYNLIIEKIEQ